MILALVYAMRCVASLGTSWICDAFLNVIEARGFI